jgi:hypothetical protein
MLSAQEVVMTVLRLQTKPLSRLLPAFVCLFVLAGASLPAVAAEPAKETRKASKTAQAAPIPQGCARLDGVERKICVECDGVAFFKRIGCQQRVFWTTCKGKRLFEDAYCQMHQDGGPPRGEGN